MLPVVHNSDALIHIRINMVNTDIQYRYQWNKTSVIVATEDTTLHYITFTDHMHLRTI